jgi:serine/threonine protein kinase
MLAPGTVLQNRYRVERQIGEGGMGAVYVATDERFGSTVALKETFFNDPSLRKAFEREARLLNHLRHPALPRVSDHFTEDEGQFLVMEYIPGEDLSDMLKSRGTPFPLRQVSAWADQLLDALEYLHTQQPPVIHRDIKPQNIKLLPREQVVLLDFGLAKGAPLQTRVTATGSVFGYSFNYAPIEQMQGAGTDTRSDLYSLGATLYHLLTATTPADALTRATAVLNGEADPLRPASEVNAGVPASVSEVLARALSQSAARRFASAAEMRSALREATQEVVSSVGPARVFRLGGGVARPAEATTVVSEETVLRQKPDGNAANTVRIAEPSILIRINQNYRHGMSARRSTMRLAASGASGYAASGHSTRWRSSAASCLRCIQSRIGTPPGRHSTRPATLRICACRGVGSLRAVARRKRYGVSTSGGLWRITSGTDSRTPSHTLTAEPEICERLAGFTSEAHQESSQACKRLPTLLMSLTRL